MERGQPSKTALGAARHRARHQLLDGGAIFADPLAVRILGPEARAALQELDADPSRRRLRLFIALRSRIAEDALATAVAGGLRQIVILGAGLDTYAYRAPSTEALRMFEVDHPATQAWKRRMLAAAAIEEPAALTFAPVDFERETLAEGLRAAGFDPSQRTFCTWLGVVPYLTDAAVLATLGFVASLPVGTHVVFDYANPPDAGDPSGGDHARLAARVAAAGEAFRSYFETPALHAELRRLGFGRIDDVGPRRVRERLAPGRALGSADSSSDRGGHVVRAQRT